MIKKRLLLSAVFVALAATVTTLGLKALIPTAKSGWWLTVCRAALPT
jgi:hypothetical protein